MTSKDTPPQPRTLFVASLAKGLQILRAFDETNTEMSLNELAMRCDLDRSAVQRLTNTLQIEGFLAKDSRTKRYRPTLNWLTLAYNYYWSDSLVHVALPEIGMLAETLRERLDLTELMGDQIVSVARFPVRRESFAATIVGRTLPALSTSSGRAILSTWSDDAREEAISTWPVKKYNDATVTDRGEIAHLVAKARELGYALMKQEYAKSEYGVAVPLRAKNGRSFGAIHTQLFAPQWSVERIHDELVPQLLHAVEMIAPVDQPT